MKDFIIKLSLIVLCVSACNVSGNDTTLSNVDILPQSKERKRKYIDLQKLDQVQLGETTESELYNIFSKDVDLRFTYNPVIPRKHLGIYKPVDKVITYDGAEISTEQINGGVRYMGKSSLIAIFFLYKGNIQFYSIALDIRDRENRWMSMPSKTTKDFLECQRNFKGDACLEIKCDDKFYELKVLKWDPASHLKGHYITAHDTECDWEKKDFDEILKKQGYDKLLKDPNYGKKFPRPEFGKD
ncbi:hypothetical protein [Leptospira sp. 'Mane']|uniref:hypothetical protein n=1 Tax=Leptospira sp. 'Mane' TaxID=3387407 RepID=UPI00398B1743